MGIMYVERCRDHIGVTWGKIGNKEIMRFRVSGLEGFRV